VSESIDGRRLDPRLAELAGAYGIATEFYDWRGGRVDISTAAAVGVLGALGVDAAGAAAVEWGLSAVRDSAWRRTLPVYAVARQGQASRIAVHVPHGEDVRVSVEFESDAGPPVAGRELDQLMVWVEPREVDGSWIGEATFELPPDLPVGYHRLIATVGPASPAGGSGPQAGCLLIVAPHRLAPPPSGWGFMLQLYAVRSTASWGIGDLGDLASLVEWSGRDLGAAFTLINPLHAAQPTSPMEPSPYFPASRRFTNPVYLRVGDVPEVALVAPEVVAGSAKPLLDGDADTAGIDRDAAWAAKRLILELAFAARTASPYRRRKAAVARESAFRAYRDREGRSLVDFATWCALADQHGLPWAQWPEVLRDARSAAVEAFRAEHAATVEFHGWLQFLCDEQLAAVQRAAVAAGMAIGVVTDLAVGVSPVGSDAWSLRDVLATGVTLGAPADIYNQQGQDWNLPPWRPDRLAEAGFGPFRELLATSLRNAGGLRVDHVIGLFRQWWVPQGSGPADGAYVRLDHEAMIGIVLIEAQRAGAVIIGEDLGNVEPWVREHLADRGILGTSILFFERCDDGRPRPPEQWRQGCLATVTTHDLPPSAGYLLGEHVELRARLGLLERPVEQERSEDDAAKLSWLTALVEHRLLDRAVLDQVRAGSGFGAALEPYLDAVVDALHAYLALTPATLLGVYLPDVAGDRRPVNQPGTVDEYPNWRVPMTGPDGAAALLGSLEAGGRARRLAQLVGRPGASVTVATSADRDLLRSGPRT
jgi:4-alpha-glucanotransferase